jgi:hypothetical protein
MNLWITGQRSDLEDATNQWAISGIYATEAEAAAACRDWTYFVMGPITLGVQAPHENVATEKGYYPIIDGRPDGYVDPPNKQQPVPAPWKENP